MRDDTALVAVARTSCMRCVLLLACGSVGLPYIVYYTNCNARKVTTVTMHVMVKSSRMDCVVIPTLNRCCTLVIAVRYGAQVSANSRKVTVVVPLRLRDDRLNEVCSPRFSAFLLVRREVVLLGLLVRHDRDTELIMILPVMNFATSVVEVR